MDNAKLKSCSVLKYPEDKLYDEQSRMFQGCPTIAVTKNGRIFLGWYSGGTCEPHMDNYNLLVYSDDNGKTWSKPVLVIPSSHEMMVHALDIQLFIDQKDILHIFWVQNNTKPISEIKPDNKNIALIDGYMFDDFTHAEWEITCVNPDDANLDFSEPRYACQGFLRCKPTVLNNGNSIFFAYDQLNDRYGYSISPDEGKTFKHFYGGKKLATDFDETMAYQMNDGKLRMFARTSLGKLGESYSFDNGLTWTDAKLSGITAADTRFFVARTPSGRVLLVLNDDPKKRCNMTLMLSDDDGITWKHKKCIDSRDDISYPDVEFYNNKIYLTYDRGRITHKEILFAIFDENDIIEDRDINVSIVSKP